MLAVILEPKAIGFSEEDAFIQSCCPFFGAWVVCVYRLQAVESLTLVNRSEPAPLFLYPYKIGVAFSKLNKAKLHRILTDGDYRGV